MENQVFIDPARYYATQRHNPRSEFYKNGLKSSVRFEGKKSRSFSVKKMSTSGDITKNVGGGGQIQLPPALLGLRHKTVVCIAKSAHIT